MSTANATPHGGLPQQVYCVECGAQLRGQNPRFCAGCGSATVTAATMADAPTEENAGHNATPDHVDDRAGQEDVDAAAVVPPVEPDVPTAQEAVLVPPSDKDAVVPALVVEADRPPEPLPESAEVAPSDEESGDGEWTSSAAEESTPDFLPREEAVPAQVLPAPVTHGGDEASQPTVYPYWDGHEWVHRPEVPAAPVEDASPAKGRLDKRLLIVGAAVLIIIALLGLSRCSSNPSGYAEGWNYIETSDTVFLNQMLFGTSTDGANTVHDRYVIVCRAFWSTPMLSGSDALPSSSQQGWIQGCADAWTKLHEESS